MIRDRITNLLPKNIDPPDRRLWLDRKHLTALLLRLEPEIGTKRRRSYI